MCCFEADTDLLCIRCIDALTAEHDKASRVALFLIDSTLQNRQSIQLRRKLGGECCAARILMIPDVRCSDCGVQHRHRLDLRMCLQKGGTLTECLWM